MIEPLIHAKTEGGSFELLAKLGGEESLINLTGIETGPIPCRIFHKPRRYNDEWQNGSRLPRCQNHRQQ